ncbi:MAG: hypothetical protein STSR0004_19530 [Peptococcaceae bacterium]
MRNRLEDTFGIDFGIINDWEAIQPVNPTNTPLSITVNINNSTIITPTLEPKRKESKAKMRRGVFTSFIHAAMKEAILERLEDGSFYAEIPSCPGVWADAKTEEKCFHVLQEVLEEWLLFKLRDGDKNFPVIGGVDLNREWKEDIFWAG